MNTTTITTTRGTAVRREIRYIDRTSKVLFKNEIDHGEEFRRILRERQGLFLVKLQCVLGVFKLSRQLLIEWKESVFRGEEEYDQADDSMIKELFAIWLPVAVRFRERAEFYARHKLPVERSAMEDLKMYVEESARILRTWSKPGVSSAISIRTRKLSAAGEKKLIALREARKATQ